ncbi:MAG: hypothetical protein ACPH9T_08450, partial [Paracoccaceae bacterium]
VSKGHGQFRPARILLNVHDDLITCKGKKNGVDGTKVARVAAQNSSLQLHIQAKRWAGIIAGKHRPFPPNASTVDAEAPGRKSKQSASSLTVTLLHQPCL